MRRRVLVAGGAIGLLTLYVAGCNRSILYRGDGRFGDAGFGAAIERYEVDLGAIDLTRVGSHSFVLAGLPGCQMTAGFKVRPLREEEKLLETEPLDAVVEMRLARRDAVVVDEQGRLSDWRWGGPMIAGSNAFVFQTGRSESIPIGSGLTQTKWLDVKADGGWGTTFTPHWLGHYDLTVSVKQPATQTYPVSLVVLGGGWKRAS